MKVFANVEAVLLDIEGTTSSVSYVFEVLFPYARDNVRAFVEQNWSEQNVQAALAQMAVDAGLSDKQWRSVDDVVAEVRRLMDADIKATGLKELQGLIWNEGYSAGQLTSHVYEDVPPVLAKWLKDGLSIHIYSSGSITARKVFFANTSYGDLTRMFSGHYDTTIGAKRDIGSYKNIAAAIGIESSAILFMSDIVAELDAAAGAGMQTALILRPHNAPQTNNIHPEMKSFGEIEIEKARGNRSTLDIRRR